jgi:hypothetical protein
MVYFQIPLPALARGFHDLKQEREFIAYFSTIDLECISPVVDCYAGIGPKGYGTALVLARIMKIKKRILSDRQLADVLKKRDQTQPPGPRSRGAWFEPPRHRRS